MSYGSFPNWIVSFLKTENISHISLGFSETPKYYTKEGKYTTIITSTS